VRKVFSVPRAFHGLFVLHAAAVSATRALPQRNPPRCRSAKHIVDMSATMIFRLPIARKRVPFAGCFLEFVQRPL
jgi:hypothetical protein